MICTNRNRPKPCARQLVATILGGILASVGLIVILWWHTSVDEHIGYCKTPTDTCINRQDAALGEPCDATAWAAAYSGSI